MAYAIAVDSVGNAYVAGGTSSSDFPVTAGALQTTYAGPPDNPDAPDPAGDAFVSKFSPLGAVVWSTYLGGSLSDGAFAIALDGSGNVYIADKGNYEVDQVTKASANCADWKQRDPQGYAAWSSDLTAATAS